MFRTHVNRPPFTRAPLRKFHVQLATRTKMFCGNTAEFGADPNTHVCPVCLGLPGALPVVNARAVELGVRAALGLHCTVHETSIFARKNYFYPDLPKGYQITQFDRPLATGGWLDAVMDGSVGDPDAATPARGSERPEGRVRIRRLHLEEDAGKSLHDRVPGRTAVDLNGAGVPLAEIVTKPDLASPARAREFLTRLKRTLEYLEVSDCDMEKGSLRVDANVSVRAADTEGPEARAELDEAGESSAPGTKTEVKNLNAFANVEKALAYEVERQIGVLENGGAVRHETRFWDEREGEARAMRSKEESHDYRYFPEPDLPPLVLASNEIERVRAELPELPGARARRYVEAYGLPEYDAGVLTASRALADYYERVAEASGEPKQASTWVTTEVLGWLNRESRSIGGAPVPAEYLAEVITLVAFGTLSSSMGRDVFGRMAESGRAPAEIVEEEGLAQVGNVDQIEAWVDEVIAENPEEVARYRAGEAKLVGFFVGRIMKKSRGKADPGKAVDRVLDPNNPDDVALLSHELTHVGQYESWGRDRYYDTAFDTHLPRLWGANPYDWNNRPIGPFSSYGMEQQGMIVQECFGGNATACGISPYKPPGGD